jgi:hypothetical protein
MQRRFAWLLIGGLAVVCLGLVLSAVVPFTTADPHAAKAPDERFRVGDADAFSAEGRIVADGEAALAFDGVVTADGAWYQRVVEPSVTAVEYYPGTGDTVVRQLRITGRERAERYRERIAEDAARALVGDETDGIRVTFVVEQNNTDPSEPVSGTASVIVNSLFSTRYERTGSDSASVTACEPRSGWYGGQAPYRITGPRGTVRANPSTLVVTSANVSWKVTRPAGSFAEYVLVRAASGAPTDRRIAYEYTPGEAEVERRAVGPRPE